jgi:hypothetical protein
MTYLVTGGSERASFEADTPRFDKAAPTNASDPASVAKVIASAIMGRVLNRSAERAV